MSYSEIITMINNFHFWFINIFSILLIIFGFLMQHSKPNYFLGFRTPTTLSNIEIWKKTNKVTGYLILITGFFFLIFNIVAYFLKIEIWFKRPEISIIIITIIILLILFYGLYYSNKLKKQLNIQKETSKLILPKNFLYTLLIISLLTIITGIILIFISPNPFIGIRIGATLKDLFVWKRVNSICGIGLIIIGLIFTHLFYKVIKEKEIENRNKLTLKYTFCFILTTILWIIVSVIYAYI